MKPFADLAHSLPYENLLGLAKLFDSMEYHLSQRTVDIKSKTPITPNNVDQQSNTIREGQMTSSMSFSSLSPSSWSELANSGLSTCEVNEVDGASGLADESCDGNGTGGPARSECIRGGRGEIVVAMAICWGSVGESSD